MRLLERWRAWRALRSYAPLSASSREGKRVRATGVVRVLDETVIAPLTGRECVVARSRIRGAPYPSVMLQIRPFLLELPAPPAVVIDGGDALLGVPAVDRRRSDLERDVSFAARFGIKATVNVWFEEVVIAPGDRVTIGGVLMHDLNPQPPSNERAFRERVPPRLRLVGSEQHPLVIVAAR
jgi:hypothetical protein